MNFRKNSKGITLVALVVTIIVLLILAGVSLSLISGGNGILDKATNAVDETNEGSAKEELELYLAECKANCYEEKYVNGNDISLLNLIKNDIGESNEKEAQNGKIVLEEGENENKLNYVINGKVIATVKIEDMGKGNGATPEPPKDPSLPTNPATTIAEAQSEYMLTKTINSPIQDAFGNRITVPAGFKIKVDGTTNNATTVDKGIVIIDSNDNEFVWIPTGTIYTATEHTEANTKTIELNRYTFDENGNPTAQNDATIDSYYQELATSTKGNTTAKDIEEFKIKASATGSGGFYIGRYEARKNSSGTITEKGTNSIWNFITQPNAGTQARNMYDNTKPFTSDLINSYAWDTATLFLQTCGTNIKYSRQNRVSSSYASTGTNNKSTKDVQCNVYDMASNCYEWTTETGWNNFDGFCVYRGGRYYDSDNYTSFRASNTASSNYDSVSFRPILYL